MQRYSGRVNEQCASAGIKRLSPWPRSLGGFALRGEGATRPSRKGEKNMLRISKFLAGAAVPLVLWTAAIANARIYGRVYAPDFAFSIDGHRYTLSGQRGKV